MLLPLPRVAPLLLLPACFFGGADGDSAKPPGDAADLLFVIDNSDSMQDEAASLAGGLGGLQEALAAAGVTDWQAGVTTASVHASEGKTEGVDPGEAGTFVGGAMFGTVDEVREAIVCQATCWNQNPPSDPDYTCGEPLVGGVTEEYLDCTCGDTWKGNCGHGMEQGLEAAYIALCRAVETPPEACYAATDGADAFAAGDEGANAGLRDDVLVVLVTDEGDASPRTEDPDVAASPGDVDPVVEGYAALFAALPLTVRFAVIGPAWDGSDASCLGGAVQWGVERYQGVATHTGGFYEPLTDLADDCAAIPVSDRMGRIADAAAE